jgi:hypothetical protein
MMAFACMMFPALGDTPPPWRWRNDVIVTSAFQHLVYAAITTAVLRALMRRQPEVTLDGEEAEVTPEVIGTAGVDVAAGASGVVGGGA